MSLLYRKTCVHSIGNRSNYQTNELANYARADGPRPLTFPADHGPHNDFQTEWWYYTGNLQTQDGRHFGYQLTFFRRALVPPAQRVKRASELAADQAYMAHFALTDVAGRQFRSFERFSRGAAGLAGAQAEPFSVWLQDWSIVRAEPDVYHLHAAQNDLTLDLTLRDVKGPILQGDRGYSQKAPTLAMPHTITASRDWRRPARCAWARRPFR